MELDAVRGHADLTVDQIEEADAGHGHRLAAGLEGAAGRVADVEGGSRFERPGLPAFAGAERIGNLCDQGVASPVLEDEVVVAVALPLVAGDYHLVLQD